MFFGKGRHISSVPPKNLCHQATEYCCSFMNNNGTSNDSFDNDLNSRFSTEKKNGKLSLLNRNPHCAPWRPFDAWKI